MIISARSVTTGKLKGGGGNDTAFEVEPYSKVTVMAHSSIYATVTFRPTAIQAYLASFEVVPDSGKGRPLTFELYGEGNLPQVSMVRPILRNSKGHSCLLFQRLSLQHHQTLPLTLRNAGTIPSTVVLEIIHGNNAFYIFPTSLSKVSPSSSGEDAKGGESHSPSLPLPPGPVTLHLAVGESTDCLIRFTPQAIKKYKGELLVTITDNMFESFPVLLVGEGYEDDISIDDIRGQAENEQATEVEEISDDLEGKTAGRQLSQKYLQTPFL